MEDTVQPKPRKQVLQPRSQTSVEERHAEIFAPWDNRGKRLIVKPSLQSALYEIAVEGGGVVPLPLRGKFTTVKAALDNIARYNKAQ